MKKHLIALAALALTAGYASAQSSVTLFGVVDVNLRSVKTGSTRLSKMENDGISSSRLGFRGEEDLGGGLKAGFWLEAPISADTGAGNTTKFFNRRSTVSLSSATLGEVRLGRDNQTIWNQAAAFDVFGTVGVATATQLFDRAGAALSTGTLDINRTDNAISYFLPGGLGGFYGQLQFAAGEGDMTATNAGTKLNGTRVGFKTGGFDAAVATSYINTQATAVTSPNGARWKQVHAGASYDFTVVKLFGQYITNKSTNPTPDAKQKVWELAASAPIGAAGLVKFGYAKSSDYKAATKIGLGYQHNLSKRTALYANFGQIKNKAATSTGVASNLVVKTAPATTAAEQKSTGYEFGIRHNF
jgi:predicted porin